MTVYGEYEVTGRRPYRGHEPGTVFEAALDGGAEQRAVRRGDIVLLRRITPDLAPGSFQLPDGWPPGAADASPAQPKAPNRVPSH